MYANLSALESLQASHGHSIPTSLMSVFNESYRQQYGKLSPDEKREIAKTLTWPKSRTMFEYGGPGTYMQYVESWKTWMDELSKLGFDVTHNPDRHTISVNMSEGTMNKYSWMQARAAPPLYKRS